MLQRENVTNDSDCSFWKIFWFDIVIECKKEYLTTMYKIS